MRAQKKLMAILFILNGRVLNIVCKGNNYNLIRKNIIQTIKKINWREWFFRKDIGWRVIKKIMRIISGKFKGKKMSYLIHQLQDLLRDYVKENIFNLLSHAKKFKN